jgi:hypothetical protein
VVKKKSIEYIIEKNDICHLVCAVYCYKCDMYNNNALSNVANIKTNANVLSDPLLCFLDHWLLKDHFIIFLHVISTVMVFIDIFCKYVNCKYCNKFKYERSGHVKGIFEIYFKPFFFYFCMFS